MKAQKITNEQIIDHLVVGLTTKEIAHLVGMRTRGVEKRIAVLRLRYKARTTTQLVCIMKGLAPIAGNR